MVAAIDLSKFRKTIGKSIPGLSEGFHDPTTWLSTGCYALNYLICGDFKGGIPLEGKFTQIAGDSGSGKSYIASANIIKAAQAKDLTVCLIDTENALDQSWLEALDVDTGPDKLLKVNGATIDDVSKMISLFIDDYRDTHKDTPYEDRPRVLIIIDSLGMLVSPTQVAQFEAGDQKGDMGIKAKQLTNMLRVTTAKIGDQPIGLLATNHVMDSQDQYQPDKIPGGKMLEFASSVIIQMNKYLLKEDEEGKKLVGGAVAGIRSTAVVRKSRYAKPFERIKIDIPYEQGMDPYSGIHDLFIAKGVLEKAGNRWSYTSPVTGEVITEYRKDCKKAGLYDLIMEEWQHWESDPTKVDLGDDANVSPEQEIEPE